MKKIQLARHLLHNEPSARWARLYLGCFFVVVAVSQLFAFEEYPDIIVSYGIPILSQFSVFVAIIVVLAEITAVPLLIGMKLSRKLKLVSLIASWLVLVYWLKVGLWQSITTEYIPNAGLFGAKVLLPQGWWLVCFIMALIVLYLFASFYRPKAR